MKPAAWWRKHLDEIAFDRVEHLLTEVQADAIESCARYLERGGTALQLRAKAKELMP